MPDLLYSVKTFERGGAAMGTTPSPEGTNQVAEFQASDGTGEGKPKRWRAARLARWALGTVVIASALAAAGFAGWKENAAASDAGALRAAFSDISNQGWSCTYGTAEDSDAHMASCETSAGDLNGPTVNFEKFDAPEPIEDTISRRALQLQEMNDYNPSNRPSVEKLVRVEDWSPMPGGRVLGLMARWHNRSGQAGLGPWSIASIRYRDRPYGITVYARSAGELNETIKSLDVPTLADLPR